MDMQAGSNVITIVADTPFPLPAGLKCLHLVVIGEHSSSTSILKDGTLVDMYADPLRDLAWKLESIVGKDCAAVTASENRILVLVEVGEYETRSRKRVHAASRPVTRRDESAFQLRRNCSCCTS